MADAVGPVRRKFLANLLPIAKQQLGMVFGLLLLLLVATFVSERFLTFPNLLNVLRQVAIVGILAIGQTFVILTAGIDLSVGSSLGLTVVFLAGLLQAELPQQIKLSSIGARLLFCMRHANWFWPLLQSKRRLSCPITFTLAEHTVPNGTICALS